MSAQGQSTGHPIDHFSWLQSIGPISHVPDYLAHAVLIAAVLIGLALLAYPQLKNTAANIIPDKKLSLKNLFELVTEFILNLLRGIIEHHPERHLPLVGTIFLFIFLSNVIGLIPGFQPPTANVNTNFGIAALVFLYYNFMGVKENGWGYLKHFMGPIVALAPLMLVIEFISHVVRPVSLSLRLFGNMTGDHMVLNIFSDLTHLSIWPITYTLGLIVPIAFLALGLLVSFIQAFVFSLLSVVYIALATAHDH